MHLLPNKQNRNVTMRRMERCSTSRKCLSNIYTNGQWHDSGLIINPTFPYLGAIPDGRAACKCCEDMPVEIKCTYCQRKRNKWYD